MRKYVCKPACLTKEQVKFIEDMMEINGTKFATELRDILADYIDYVESDKVEKCAECRWISRKVREKQKGEKQT